MEEIQLCKNCQWCETDCYNTYAYCRKNVRNFNPVTGEVSLEACINVRKRYQDLKVCPMYEERILETKTFTDLWGTFKSFFEPFINK